MKTLIIVMCSALCLFNIQVYAQKEVKGIVTKVLDGNTLLLTSVNKEEMLLVLYGVDSPELEQEYGKEAKQLLEKTLLKKNVTVQLLGMDRKGNKFAIVTTTKDVDPRVTLLKKGLAWTDEKNPIPDLESVRLQAKKKGVGLWEQSEPTPPWLFRRQQTMMNPKSS